MGFGTLNAVVLAVYLLVLLAVGMGWSRRQSTGEDFFLAGRRLPGWAVGMSMFASLTSATTAMGVPAFAYEHNVAMLFGVLMSPLVALILIRWVYPLYRRRGLTTSYQFIQERFGSPARAAVAWLFVLGRIGWLGIVVYAPAKALNVATGIPLSLAVVLIGLLATAYTALGGLAAVIWTDVIQFVVLVGGMAWVGLSLVRQVPGGATEILHLAQQSGKLDVWQWSDFAHLTAWSAMIGWFFVFLNDYGTDQVTVQRLLAVRSDRGVCWAVGFNACTDVLMNGWLLFVGLGLAAYFHRFPDRLAGAVEADGILPYYAMAALPAGVSGLLITALFAAAMSSVDSGINSIATVMIRDLIEPWRPGLIAARREVAWARGLTIALGLAATATALGASRLGHIVQLWMRVTGLFSAPVLSLFVLGWLSRRATLRGWGIGAGVAVAVSVTVQWLLHDRLMEIWVFPLSFGITTAIGWWADGSLRSAVPAARGVDDEEPMS